MRIRVQVAGGEEVRARPTPHNKVQTLQVAQNGQASGLTIPLPGKTSTDHRQSVAVSQDSTNHVKDTRRMC